MHSRCVRWDGDEIHICVVHHYVGAKLAALVDNKHDGTYRCAYTPLEKGQHQIDVSYDGIPVPQSPFPVLVSPGFDAGRVKAYGPGLQGIHLRCPLCPLLHFDCVLNWTGLENSEVN